MQVRADYPASDGFPITHSRKGRVFKHLSATHNQTLHTKGGSIDARATTPVGRTVGRYPRLTL